MILSQYQHKAAQANDGAPELVTGQQARFLSNFKRWTWIILLLSALCQLVFFFSAANLFGVVCVLIAWKLTELSVLNAPSLNRYPLSATVILGYSLTQYCLPCVFTLLEKKPLVYNLDLPYSVFIHSFFALLILLSAFELYKVMRSRKQASFALTQKALIKINAFTAPGSLQLWLIGFFGLLGIIGTYYTGTRYGLEDHERGGAAKLFQALIPFAYTPYFIPLRSLFDYSEKKYKAPVLMLVLYTLLLILIGVGGNHRSLFMTGLTTAGIAYFLGLLLGKFNLRVFNLKAVVPGLIALWFVTGPLANLGTAMVMVRSMRADVSGTDLLEQTLEVSQNERMLARFKATSPKEVVDWDEDYFDNIFLARFCNLKFNDEGLKQSERIGKVDRKMQEYSIARIWSIFPLPVLQALDIEIDKEQVISGSFGDYLFDRAGGSNAIGGFRTGQFASTGMASFGWWYLAILFIGVIPIFYCFDIFVLRMKSSDGISMKTIISLPGLVPITLTFMFFSLSTASESVVNTFSYLLRAWPQTLIIYIILFFVSKKVSLLLSPAKRISAVNKKFAQ
ncbi:hypothetical protein ACX0G7_23460 [Flavitalea antarctica]